MSTVMEYDMLDSLNLERKLLLYCGIYPYNGKTKYKFLYYLSAFYHISVSLLLYLSIITLMLLNATNMSVLIDVLQVLGTETGYLSKLINLIKNKKQLVEIEKLLSNSIFLVQSEKNVKTIISSVSFTKSFAMFYRFNGALICSVYLLFPFFVGDLEDIKPVVGWNPWGSGNKVIRSHILHCVAVSVTAHINCCIDILTCMLMTLAASQLESLQNNLSNIKYDSKDAKHVFARNIQLHYEILRFVDLIQKTFSNGIFVQFFASVVAICFIGFEVTVVPPLSMQFVFVFVYLFGILTEVGMYCWFGHVIITSSDKLCEAIYMSNWYEADQSLKKSIIIFMEKCKRPVVVTAGNFFTLSLMTSMSIIRASYSYITVLQQMYDSE